MCLINKQVPPVGASHSFVLQIYICVTSLSLIPVCRLFFYYTVNRLTSCPIELFLCITVCMSLKICLKELSRLESFVHQRLEGRRIFLLIFEGSCQNGSIGCSFLLVDLAKHFKPLKKAAQDQSGFWSYC